MSQAHGLGNAHWIVYYKCAHGVRYIGPHIAVGTVQSLYNTPNCNMDLVMLLLKELPWKFTNDL